MNAIRLASRALLLAAGLALATPALAAESPFTGPTRLVMPAEPAAMPDFSLPEAKGGVVRASELKGRVIVIRFWATW